MKRHELTDEQWTLVEPLLPRKKQRKSPAGRKPVDRRTLLNGVFWILHTGAPWRDLPERFGNWLYRIVDGTALNLRRGDRQRALYAIENGRIVDFVKVLHPGSSDYKIGDVVNYIPHQRAANIARDAGLITANNRWCEVDWTTMQSIKVPNIHVLGDATMPAPAMPKSGHMANQHGKAAAAAIVELMSGRAAIPPMMANTCYSFVDDRNAVHVASVHTWVREKKTMEAVAGAGGISTQDRASWALEGNYAQSWARTIWADMLT